MIETVKVTVPRIKRFWCVSSRFSFARGIRVSSRNSLLGGLIATSRTAQRVTQYVVITCIERTRAAPTSAPPNGSRRPVAISNRPQATCLLRPRSILDLFWHRSIYIIPNVRFSSLNTSPHLFEPSLRCSLRCLWIVIDFLLPAISSSLRLFHVIRSQICVLISVILLC